jgi:hypothetical protein
MIVVHGGDVLKKWMKSLLKHGDFMAKTQKFELCCTRQNNHVGDKVL